ncbi:30S ribosomal protein S1 [Alkalihalobacillus trypoxylicola]|uniref:30S ribosomal protein S1 n=1 Tax=Alkalihalobacillus trypoxylicola TaxID=519424 RepID=A0A162EKC6_9BACI|nr:30S ribosomal protein S1 [Alkalihalobacillus trypoxylicola]KYG33119.1 30S ribosomal protein S1 [Alkalihalobacillus trypoxylicola]
MTEEMKNGLEELKALEVGDVVSGKVTKVEEKQALVDVGYKLDGIIPISELSSLHVEKVSDVLSVDEELELKIIKLEDDELILSKRAVLSEKAWEKLQQAFTENELLEVEVAEVVKGGLVVDLGVRGFIPASLVERHYVEDFSDYKGKLVRLKVVELDKEHNKLILSQRAVLDEEEDQKKKNVLQEIQAGDVIEGTVQRLTNFGAFVDLGGVDGLVHISQLAHHRVETPSDVVSEGDQVKVKVLSVDTESERVSLSIKDTLPGPWEKVEQQLQVGDTVKGIVRRMVSFGAFIEVADGVEGLVHISQIANRHIGTPSEVLTEGEEVEAKVLDINKEEKRISLSIRALLQEDSGQENYEEYEKMKEEESTGFSLGDMIGDQLKKYKS